MANKLTKRPSPSPVLRETQVRCRRYRLTLTRSGFPHLWNKKDCFIVIRRWHLRHFLAVTCIINRSYSSDVERNRNCDANLLFCFHQGEWSWYWNEGLRRIWCLAWMPDLQPNVQLRTLTLSLGLLLLTREGIPLAAGTLKIYTSSLQTNTSRPESLQGFADGTDN